MKGIIVAGGNGTRLRPLTKVTSKQLLPVYNKPMIYYPLYTLLSGGIKEIAIVAAENQVENFVNLLGDGGEFGCKFEYFSQQQALGISHAVYQAKDFVKGEDCTVILGDNIFLDDLSDHIRNFEGGCELFLKEVADSRRFGVPTLEGERIVKVTEKPAEPDSNYAITGLYIYDSRMMELIETLEYSDRGELEITSLNSIYVKEGVAKANFVDGGWYDAGTFESLYEVSSKVRNMVMESDMQRVPRNLYKFLSEANLVRSE